MLASRASVRVDVERVLGFLTAIRAAGEAVAGPVALSKKARKLERRLIRVLTTSWQGAVDVAVERASSVLLTGSAKVTESELDEVLAGVAQKLGPSYSSAVLGDASEVLTASYSLGRSLFERSEDKPKAVSFSLVDQRAVDWLERDHQYWVGSYYDRKLGEQIAASVKTTILEQGLGRKEAGKALEKLVTGMTLDDSVVGRSGYWEGVAAVAATRARTFGAIEGLVQAGIETFEFVAVMDERTSAICRELNGRIFSVSEAVDLRDSVLAAESPEDVKAVTPWVHADKAKTASSKDLQAKGVCMPPAHFRCRSTVIASFQAPQGVSVKTPSGASKRTKNAFAALEPDELTNKLTLNRVAPSQIEFDTSGRLAKLHGGNPAEFNPPYTTASPYATGARKLMQTATTIFGRGDLAHGRIYQFVDEASKAVTTATDGGEILAHVGYNHLPSAKWKRVLARYRKTHMEIAGLPTVDEIAADAFAVVHPEAK